VTDDPRSATELDDDAVRDVLARLCTAVLDDADPDAALGLLAHELRREWAYDVVNEQCDAVDVLAEPPSVDPPLSWDDRDADAESLARLETTHRAWPLFVDDVMDTLAAECRHLRRALAAEDGMLLHVRRALTPEQARTAGGGWSTGGVEDPTAPLEVGVAMALEAAARAVTTSTPASGACGRSRPTGRRRCRRPAR